MANTKQIISRVACHPTSSRKENMVIKWFVIGYHCIAGLHETDTRQCHRSMAEHNIASYASNHNDVELKDNRSA